MKYELIKKILNSSITILDYLILEHIANNTAKEFIEDKYENPFDAGTIYSTYSRLKKTEYISNLKLDI